MYWKIILDINTVKEQDKTTRLPNSLATMISQLSQRDIAPVARENVEGGGGGGANERKKKWYTVSDEPVHKQKKITQESKHLNIK